MPAKARAAAKANASTLRAGLAAQYYIDGDGDGENGFETLVCDDLSGPWTDNDGLVERPRSFRLRHDLGSTPCGDITFGTPWGARFKGYIKVGTTRATGGERVKAQKVSVDIDADVNDGVGMVIFDTKGKGAICELRLWQNVPEYHKYHSTDAYDIDYGCETTLQEGDLYPVEIELYFEPDRNTGNGLFNRAYLDLWLNGLGLDRYVEFYHDDASLDVLATQTVIPPAGVSMENEWFEYEEGLTRSYYVDESEVCADLAEVWHGDPRLRIRDRSFGFFYPAGTTPCAEIEYGDRWYGAFEGFLVVSATNGEDRTFDVSFTADVNDGVSMVIMEPDSPDSAALCHLALWRDVPEFHNYHSTDAFDVDYGCEATLETGVYYPFRLDFFHEPDIHRGHWLFNRAYLDMFTRGLIEGGQPAGQLRFYRKVTW
jgi:hypothetical protein